MSKTDASHPPAPTRDRFLAHLSHELRTPLGGVLGMAQLLAGTRLEPDQVAYVSAIRECGEHLLGLVNNVLDLARLESGAPELAPGPVDLVRLMQGVTELLSPRAHAKGLQIAWAPDGPLPIVEADEGRLRQVLFNLAGNAVKFTQTGGVLITICARPAAEGRVRLTLAVTDTGPGIAEADRARIFQPFVQAEAVRSGEDSTGLGLAIVKRLAVAMGGEVSLDSLPGAGSTFRFAAETPVLEPASRSMPLSGVKVAVVSPSPVVRAAARLQVEAAGGRALGYASCRAARHAPREAVMLIDDDLRRGRSRLIPAEGRASLVLLPAEKRSRIAPSRRAGFKAYLIKPLRVASLVERVLAVSSSPAERPATAAVVDERARSATRARVLLAEDNPVNAMLARALLSREGCESQNARSGPEALEFARAARFDLILMDLRLPGMDGLDVTRVLRAEGDRTPIVALTADGFEEDRRACLAAGMDDFLVKPLDPAVLQGLLARVASGAFTEHPAEAKLAS